MKIFEVASPNSPDPDKLLGLVEFLAGRAEDTNSRKQIDQDAFVDIARSLGVSVTRNNLHELVNQPPLSNVLEPLTPNTDDPIVFKGGETKPPAMPVNKAQDIVAKAAKSAMKRGMK